MLLLVVPGFVYTGTRRHLRGGATADEKDFSVRLVHGIAASVVLNCCYLIAAGPWLVGIISGQTGTDDGLGLIGERPREAGGVPVALAFAVNWISRLTWVAERRERQPFSPTTSAWDYIAPKRADCFERIRTSEGRWTGGYIEESDSFFSTYPEPRDLFITEEWVMGNDGSFIAPVPCSQGIYVPLSGSELVSWSDEPPQPELSPAPPGGGRRGGRGGAA